MQTGKVGHWIEVKQGEQGPALVVKKGIIIDYRDTIALIHSKGKWEEVEGFRVKTLDEIIKDVSEAI